MTPASVLVLAGGPDAERDVSLRSAAAVADALAQAGHAVQTEVIDRPSGGEIAAMAGEVIFPVLHGAFGEGGPMQDLLVADGRPFVGCGPRAARVAMDKFATKLAAANAGVKTAPAGLLNPADLRSPIAPPCVIKPVHEGSSVGLHVCRTGDDFVRAVRAIQHQAGAFEKLWMVERMIAGRELTAGLIAPDEDGTGALEALPIVEICAATGVYDFEAKYGRDDTRYVVDPELAPGVGESLKDAAVRTAAAIGVRHLARVDFLLDESGEAWLLEINTMPGFTGASLLPKAAAGVGIDLPALTSRLVSAAMAESGGERVARDFGKDKSVNHG